VWYLTAHGTLKGGKEECNAVEGYFQIHGKKIHGVDIVRALTAAGKIYQRIVVLVDVCYSSSLFQSLTPKNHKGITVFTCGEEDEQCYMAKWTRNVTSGSLFNRRLVLFTITLEVYSLLCLLPCKLKKIKLIFYIFYIFKKTAFEPGKNLVLD
jgi:hypothetical protein